MVIETKHSNLRQNKRSNDHVSSLRGLEEYKPRMERMADD